MMLMKARSVCVYLEGFICSVRVCRRGLQGSPGLELITGLIYPANKWNSFLTHYGLGHFHITLACNTHTHGGMYTHRARGSVEKKCAISLKVTYLHSFMREPHQTQHQL